MRPTTAAASGANSSTGQRLLLVRHGQSTWNRDRRWAGQADPPLTDRGRSEARLLAQRLAGIEFDRVVSSDLRRASETALLLARALGAPDPIEDARLRERAAVWSGMTIDEIEAAYPGMLDAWRSGESHKLPPGSEPWQPFQARVFGSIDEHIRHGRSVLAVAHAGVFRVAGTLFGVRRRRVGNTEGQWLFLNDNSIEPGPTVEST